MVLDLVDFFHITGGMHWLRNDHWLEGEPCENGWYGVVCCPEGFPLIDEEGRCHMVDDSEWLLAGGNVTNRSAFNADFRGRPVVGVGRRLQADGGDLDGSSSPPPEYAGLRVAPFGCRSGTSFGTVADRSKCRVAMLDLSSNNLTGTFARNESGVWTPMLCALQSLQVLLLHNNSLGGEVPNGFGAVLGAALPTNATAGSPDGASVTVEAGGGSVGSVERCMSRLRYMDVEDNLLSGPFPNELARALPVVRLGSAQLTENFPLGNAFHYPEERISLTDRFVLQQIEQTARTCELKELAGVGECTGVPPQTCDAFGGKGKLFVPKTSSKSRCAAEIQPSS